MASVTGREEAPDAEDEEEEVAQLDRAMRARRAGVSRRMSNESGGELQ
jgi:hypothetical protein